MHLPRRQAVRENEIPYGTVGLGVAWHARVKFHFQPQLSIPGKYLVDMLALPCLRGLYSIRDTLTDTIKSTQPLPGKQASKQASIVHGLHYGRFP